MPLRFSETSRSTRNVPVQPASGRRGGNASPPGNDPLAREFVRFSVEAGVLRFGEFRTKAGRLSPYFFDAGRFDDGARLGRLAQFYARRLLGEGAPAGAGAPAFDMLFGPAYKGIALAATVAVELARLGRNVAYAYNRKEAKDHGEGGTLVGAPVRGRVLVIDDVISAGTSMRESVAMISAAGAEPCGLAIALDRQERATGADGGEAPWSAVQYVRRQFGLQVTAIATLADLLDYLQHHRRRRALRRTPDASPPIASGTACEAAGRHAGSDRRAPAAAAVDCCGRACRRCWRCAFAGAGRRARDVDLHLRRRLRQAPHRRPADPRVQQPRAAQAQPRRLGAGGDRAEPTADERADAEAAERRAAARARGAARRRAPRPQPAAALSERGRCTGAPGTPRWPT